MTQLTIQQIDQINADPAFKAICSNDPVIKYTEPYTDCDSEQYNEQFEVVYYTRLNELHLEYLANNKSSVRELSNETSNALYDLTRTKEGRQELADFVQVSVMQCMSATQQVHLVHYLYEQGITDMDEINHVLLIPGIGGLQHG